MADRQKSTAQRVDPPLDPEPAAPPARRRRQTLRWTLLIVGPLMVLTGVGYYYLTGGRYVSIDNAYVRADKVDISPEISGVVRSVDVQNNQTVAAGQVLIRLKDERMRIAVAKAEGQLESSRSEIAALQATYRQKQEAMRQAGIDIAFYRRDLDRQMDLVQHSATPISQLDTSRHNFDRAREAMAMLNQDLAGIAASLDGDPDMPVDQHPRVRTAQADLAEANRQLRHAIIRAPFAGIVTQVQNVQPGAYLAAAQPAFALVATDRVWIEANPKETDLTYVQAGQPATVTVDTYPDTQWHGSVDSLSPASSAEFALLPAQNTSGNWVKVVQRIPVQIRVELTPDKPMLRAGMSVAVTVDTGHQRAMPRVLASLLGMSPSGISPVASAEAGVPKPYQGISVPSH
jgi:membrane fusion protein (multidrug efflux system)